MSTSAKKAESGGAVAKEVVVKGGGGQKLVCDGDMCRLVPAAGGGDQVGSETGTSVHSGVSAMHSAKYGSHVWSDTPVSNAVREQVDSGMTEHRKEMTALRDAILVTATSSVQASDGLRKEVAELRAELRATVAALQQRIAEIQLAPGPPGPMGMMGRDGRDCKCPHDH